MRLYGRIRLSRNFGAVAALVLLLTGCTTYYAHLLRQSISENQQALQELRLGMTSAQVVALMGEGEVVRYKRIHLVDPWRSEGFSLVDGTNVLILFYVTKPPEDYFVEIGDQELSPIVFENDALVGWGWSYLRRSTERYRISTPQEQR